jgi:tellurite resistance protein TerC
MLTPWIIFIAFVLLMLALDLGVFHKQAHVIGYKESLTWSAIWITLGLSFSALVYQAYEHHWWGLGAHVDAVDGLINNGKLAATKYLTGYIVEKSLSVDNIFVIAMVFGSLAVPARYQHRVLFWGIIGALVMRGAMIGIGSALVTNFHWVLYLFGGFLILTALKMLFMKEKEEHPENNPVVRWIRRYFPVTRDYHGQHFFVKAGSNASLEASEPGATLIQDPIVANAPTGKWLITPLFVALILVEITDLIFAVDSIPAIFAITADPFLVFTSNVFAILGLRSLYFALAGMIHQFHYLKPALALILLIVGIKMLAAKWLKQLLGDSFHFTILGVILGILLTGIVSSLIFIKEEKDKTPKP